MAGHSVMVGTVCGITVVGMCVRGASVSAEHNQTPSSLHKGDFITLKGQTGGGEGSVSGRVCVCVGGCQLPLQRQQQVSLQNWFLRGKGGRKSVLG